MNRLPDAPAVLRLIDGFYDPLIARGAERMRPGADPAWMEAA
jgi:hypothetical protein